MKQFTIAGPVSSEELSISISRNPCALVVRISGREGDPNALARLDAITDFDRLTKAFAAARSAAPLRGYRQLNPELRKFAVSRFSFGPYRVVCSAQHVVPLFAVTGGKRRRTHLVSVEIFKKAFAESVASFQIGGELLSNGQVRNAGFRLRDPQHLVRMKQAV